MARYAALLLLLAALAGCGETTVREEPSITVSGGEPRRDQAPGASPAGEDAPRIAVVTHGQASSPFWAIVRTGVEAAERQMNVQVDYEAPDVYSLAAHDRADRRRRRGAAGRARRVLPRARPGARDPARGQGRHPGHHDQLRQRRVPLARRARPRRPARGPRRARRRPAPRARGRAPGAVRQPAGRQRRPRRPLRRPGAGDARRRRQRARARHRRPERRDAARGSPRAVAAGRSTASSPPTPPAACRRSRRVARSRRAAACRSPPSTSARTRCAPCEAGKLLFAVDQQPYLQGYLPVVMLANRARYGLLPGAGRRGRHGRELRHPGERRPGARAQRALDPLKHAACGMPHAMAV